MLGFCWSVCFRVERGESVKAVQPRSLAEQTHSLLVLRQGGARLRGRGVSDNASQNHALPLNIQLFLFFVCRPSCQSRG